MSDALTAALVCAALTAALAGLGPALIARLPEPAPEPAPEPENGPATDPDQQPPDEPATAGQSVKVAYAVLARRPLLSLKFGVVGALVGAVVGWGLELEPVTPLWIFVGAVGIVLGYVDAQTRLLPTRIIAPSYAVVIVLTVLAAALDDDWWLLRDAALGWLVMGGFYVLLWLVYPKGRCEPE